MVELKEERLTEELQKASISLVIDTYDDIFSDFDPRPFNERALSDDFLLECKRAARDKEEGLELLMAVPKDKRKTDDETKISKRLKDHFKKHYLEKQKEISKIKNEGWTWVFIGTVLMIVAGILETYTAGFLINLLIIVLIPAGWFSFWEGFGKILIFAREKSPDQEFYRKMSSAKIEFRSF